MYLMSESFIWSMKRLKICLNAKKEKEIWKEKYINFIYGKYILLHVNKILSHFHLTKLYLICDGRKRCHGPNMSFISSKF